MADSAKEFWAKEFFTQEGFVPRRKGFWAKGFFTRRDFVRRNFVPQRNFERRDFVPRRDFEQRDIVPKGKCAKGFWNRALIYPSLIYKSLSFLWQFSRSDIWKLTKSFSFFLDLIYELHLSCLATFEQRRLVKRTNVWLKKHMGTTYCFFVARKQESKRFLLTLADGTTTYIFWNYFRFLSIFKVLKSSRNQHNKSEIMSQKSSNYL